MRVVLFGIFRGDRGFMAQVVDHCWIRESGSFSANANTSSNLMSCRSSKLSSAASRTLGRSSLSNCLRKATSLRSRSAPHPA